MSLNTTADQQIQTQAVSSVVAQTVAAMVFGASILFAVGFLPMSAAHNAAHDVRHTLAFPCH